VEYGAKVLEDGIPQLQIMVEDGLVAVSAAAEIAKLPAKEQDSIAVLGAAHVKKRASETKKKVVKKRKREEAEMFVDDIPKEKANVIYTRVPVEKLPWELIENAPLEDLAKDDAVLFLWAVPLNLLSMIDLMKTWGFEYKDHSAWTGASWGKSHYHEQKHRLLLVGTRGIVMPPDDPDKPGSVHRGEWKNNVPKGARELIESLCPGKDYLELFPQHEPRKGWRTWGQSPDEIVKQGS